MSIFEGVSRDACAERFPIDSMFIDAHQGRWDGTLIGIERDPFILPPPPGCVASEGHITGDRSYAKEQNH